MALITCPECKKKISDNANSCPNCGYQLTPEKITEIKKKAEKIKKNTNISYFIFSAWQSRFKIRNIFLVVIAIILAVYLTPKKQITSEKTPTPEEMRKEQIEKYFSSWDGSHIELTRHIKESMNDPSSFQHVKTEYTDKRDYLIVKTTFRGKNAFGAYVVNWVTAKVNLYGTVIEILSRGP